MDDTVYAPQEIADITGVSVAHLTRAKDGPIARILETHHWERERLSPDGKSLSEYGIDILENYLREVGKKGNGLTYEQWQKNQWEKHQPSNIVTVEQPLIPVETYTPNRENWSQHLTPFSFGEELKNWANQQSVVSYQRTLDLFRQAITIPTVKAINDGRNELKEVLKNLGG